MRPRIAFSIPVILFSALCHPERTQAKSEAIGLAKSKDPYPLSSFAFYHPLNVRPLRTMTK
jgi:hypothetical protein